MASETTNLEGIGEYTPTDEQSNCANPQSDQRSNNATHVDVPGRTDIVLSTDSPSEKLTDGALADADVRYAEKQEACSGQVHAVFEGENDDGFCVLRRSTSEDNYEVDDHEMQKQNKPEIDTDDHTEEYDDHRNLEDSPYTDSPRVFSQEELPSGNDDEDTEYTDSIVDDRISNIEEEYIQRIYGLEQRHYELEDVLARLASCLDEAFNEKEAEDATAECEPTEYLATEEGLLDESVDVDDASKTDGRTAFKEKIGLELFIEFQNKLRNFASDLNGVLNCSEAAIRHARVVQQWATSVQIMFEQIKEERTKILNYVDERERSILVVKEQFIAEFQEQGKQLQQLVDEMNSFAELREKADDYCRKKMEEEGVGKNLVGRIVDAVLEKRMQHEQSIMLSLNKQSKISELKLFIIHQQNCIQQIQEQNKELKAIIEGLMGPEDIDEEEELCDTDQSGTPASVSSPDRCPVRDVLNKLDDSPLCLVSDVLHCDRGEYLAGTSTDGDIATIQTYNIGNDTDQLDTGENTVFDPLSVSYVRQQCQMAEETERKIHESENIVAEDLTYTDEGVKVIQDGIDAINIEPYLRKMAEQEQQTNASDNQDAAGDGIDKTIQTSPNKNDVVTKPEMTEQSSADLPSVAVTPPSPDDQGSSAV